MAQIQIRNLSHSYRPNPSSAEDFALKDVNIQWRDGGAYALLGPSGCGKSTLLRIVSGLLRPTTGGVLFDGWDVTPLSARQRHVAEVFQFPVVYETLSVFDNLAFPLRNRGVRRETVVRRVAEVAELLGLTDRLSDKSSSLAAAARQLVSLGRGLVRTDVNAMLFDEPLTVIDPQEKWHLRTRLKQLHQQFALTMIYVTHDQTEALTFADTIMVMLDGQIVQSAAPDELFNRPEHKFVGQFIGSPGMNFIPCQLDRDVAVVAGHSIALGRSYDECLAGACELGFRPEHVQLSGDKNGIPASIRHVENTGRRRIVHLDAAGTSLCVSLPAGQEIPANGVHFLVEPARALVYADDKLVSAQQ